MDQHLYGQAIEDLSKIIQKDPSNHVALFNRALIFQKLNMISSAVDDWEKLLRVEDDPAWRDEAQRQLANLQEKKNPER